MLSLVNWLSPEPIHHISVLKATVSLSFDSYRMRDASGIAKVSIYHESDAVEIGDERWR